MLAVTHHHHHQCITVLTTHNFFLSLFNYKFRESWDFYNGNFLSSITETTRASDMCCCNQGYLLHQCNVNHQSQKLMLMHSQYLHLRPHLSFPVAPIIFFTAQGSHSECYTRCYSSLMLFMWGKLLLSFLNFHKLVILSHQSGDLLLAHHDDVYTDRLTEVMCSRIFHCKLLIHFHYQSGFCGEVL